MLIKTSNVILYLFMVVFAFAVNEVEQIQLADGLYSRGMYEMAAAEYRRFIAEYPKSELMPRAMFYLGYSLKNIGDNKNAEAVFRDVYAKYPASEYRFRAAYARAQIFSELQQYSYAVYVLKNMLKENVPSDIMPSALYLLGDSLGRNGEFAEAIEVFESIGKRYPSSPQNAYATLEMARIYSGLDGYGSQEIKIDVDKAIVLYKKIAATPPDERIGAESLFQLGRLLFQQKDFAGSADVYRQLITKYSSNSSYISRAKLGLTWAIYFSGMYADAYKNALEMIDNMQTNATAFNDEPQWLYLKANCERSLGKTKDAIASYDHLIKKYSSSPFAGKARYEKVMCFYVTGDFSEAIKEAESIKDNTEIRAEILKIMAKSYEKKGDIDKAIQYYKLYINEFPNDDFVPEAMFNIGCNLKGKESFKEASEYFVKFAEQYPTNFLASDAIFSAGICFEKMNKLSEAVKYWEKIVINYSGDNCVNDALYRKGIAELKLNLDKDASATFERLSQRDLKGKYAAESFYWRGFLAAKTNAFADAIALYKQALSLSPSKDMEPEIKFSMAYLLLKTGDTNQAAVIFFQLLDKVDDSKFNPSLLKWLAEYAVERKTYDDAIKASKLLLKKVNEDSWLQTAYAMLGRAYYNKGDKKSARESYGAVLGIKGDTVFSSEAALRIGEIELESGNVKVAYDYYSQAARLASSDDQLAIRAKAYFGLGRSAILLNDFDKAARYFMSVAVLYDDDELVPESLYEAASSFYKLHRDDEGRKAVEELQARYPDSQWTKKAISLKK